MGEAVRFLVLAAARGPTFPSGRTTI